MTDKTDRRIEKTQSALGAALLQLLRKLDWGDVNVAMICKKANVARSSFYLHYDNKQALLDDVFDAGLKNARQYITQNVSPSGGYASITWLVEHIFESRDFFNKGQTSSDLIFRRFQLSFQELLSMELDLRGSKQKDDIVVFLVGGIFALLRNWAANNCANPVKEVGADLNALAKKVLENYTA